MAKNGVQYELTKSVLGMSLTQRAAHFLDWNAKVHPGQFTAYNEVVKIIQGYKRQPQLKSEEVEQLRKRMTSIKTVLFSVYKREVVSLPGVGVRAAYDDGDTLKNVVPAKAVRLQSARNNFIRTVSNVDQTKIANTPDMVPLKAWLNNEIKAVMKQISSAEFERKLLPPVAQKAEE